MALALGISGRLQHGKDTLAKFIQEVDPQSDWRVKKFAWKLKQICGILCGVDPIEFEDQEFKKQMSPFGVMTYRELLQKVGTEAIRNQIDTNAWVKALFAEYQKIAFIEDQPNPILSSEFPNWIVTDVRFPNEADEIKYRGGIMIRVSRPGFVQLVELHPSETAMDDYEFDYVVNNDSGLDKLKTEAKNILELTKSFP